MHLRKRDMIPSINCICGPKPVAMQLDSLRQKALQLLSMAQLMLLTGVSATCCKSQR